MWRDNLTAKLTNTNWISTDHPPEQPCININYGGPINHLEDQLQQPDGRRYTSSDFDVNYRFQETKHPESTGGVLSITDRISGEYILEADAYTDRIGTFIHAVNRYADVTGHTPQYRIVIQASENQVASFEKNGFLVYSSEGQLLRDRSLIPDSVEI
jgi:hypothetical protein